jgi:hypothetical protein
MDVNDDEDARIPEEGVGTMRASPHSPYRFRQRPVENRQVAVVADRVVEFETCHIAESVWSASGRVSDPLPTGPRVSRPIVMHGLGHTEDEAIADLCQQVTRLPRMSTAVPQPELPS